MRGQTYDWGRGPLAPLRTASDGKGILKLGRQVCGIEPPTLAYRALPKGFAENR